MGVSFDVWVELSIDGLSPCNSLNSIYQTLEKKKWIKG
jgi:hypothetical protein